MLVTVIKIKTIHRSLVAFGCMALVLVASLYVNVREYRALMIMNGVVATLSTHAIVVSAPQAELPSMAEQIRSKHQVIAKVTDLIERQYHIAPNDAIQIAYAHWDASVKYGIPIWIGLGVNAHETSFNCHQVSDNHSSYGCMQINPHQNFRGRLSVAQLWNMASNIEIGYKILSLDRQQYRSIDAALEHYYGSKDTQANYQYASVVLQTANGFWRQSLAS